jgi:hypothetical protein
MPEWSDSASHRDGSGLSPEPSGPRRIPGDGPLVRVMRGLRPRFHGTRLVPTAVFLLAGFLAPLSGRPISPSRMTSLSLEIGNWQPQSLNAQPAFSTFGKSGASPLYAGGVSLPVGKDMGIRLSTGFWSLSDLNREDPVHSLVLYSLNLDLKYWLVPDFRLSAYVLYGAGATWGVENEAAPFGGRLRKAKPGWGANLGAGFDLAASRRFGLGAVFEYRFIRFNRPLGGLTDFSGPKIGISFYYFP